MVEIQAYQCSNIISYLLKLAWQLPLGTSFNYVIATSSVSEVQYKNMIIDRWWKVLTEIINVIKSKV